MRALLFLLFISSSALAGDHAKANFRVDCITLAQRAVTARRDPVFPAPLIHRVDLRQVAISNLRPDTVRVIPLRPTGDGKTRYLVSALGNYRVYELNSRSHFVEKISAADEPIRLGRKAQLIGAYAGIPVGFTKPVSSTTIWSVLKSMRGETPIETAISPYFLLEPQHRLSASDPLDEQPLEVIWVRSTMSIAAGRSALISAAVIAAAVGSMPVVSLRSGLQDELLMNRVIHVLPEMKINRLMRGDSYYVLRGIERLNPLQFPSIVQERADNDAPNRNSEMFGYPYQGSLPLRGIPSLQTVDEANQAKLIADWQAHEKLIEERLSDEEFLDAWFKSLPKFVSRQFSLVIDPHLFDPFYFPGETWHLADKNALALRLTVQEILLHPKTLRGKNWDEWMAIAIENNYFWAGPPHSHLHDKNDTGIPEGLYGEELKQFLKQWRLEKLNQKK